MSNYQRLISYIYEYEGGNKVPPQAEPEALISRSGPP